MCRRVEIIIGLPCSGKSHLAREFESKGYKVYDDFLTTFHNGRMLREEGNVCLSDPRLCNFETFCNVLSQLRNLENLHLHIFENDPDACIINLSKRNETGDTRPGILNNILYLTAIYDVSNYRGYDHTVLPVYGSRLMNKYPE